MHVEDASYVYSNCCTIYRFIYSEIDVVKLKFKLKHRHRARASEFTRPSLPVEFTKSNNTSYIQRIRLQCWPPLTIRAANTINK